MGLSETAYTVAIATAIKSPLSQVLKAVNKML